MKWLDLLHRWTGGVIGLVLGLLGLTGCLLVWKTALNRRRDRGRIADQR